MKTYTIIPATDPKCRELQNGYSNYNDGLILADSKFTDLDGEWLVGPVHSRPDGYRAGSGLYANVHVAITRMDGKTVYGIRYWTDRCTDRGYMTHTASGLSSDRKHTVSRAYINEHYTDVQESGEVIVCNDDRGNEHKFDAVKGLDGWFVENRKR
jgi:hypothetical protein